MTGEVEVVAWRVRPRGDAVWHLTDDPRPNTGYEREPLVPASALEALRADKERLEKERDEARKRAGIDHDAANRYVNEMIDLRTRAEASLAGRDAEIAKAVAEEREACAKLLDEHAAACRTNAEFWKTHKKPDLQEAFEAMAVECEDAATAIRARAQEPR
jgi:hypothetical protein